MKHLQTAYHNLQYRLKDAEAGSDPKIDQEIRQIEADFVDMMDDDFNVQNGIAQVYELAKLGNVYAEQPVVLQDSVNFILKTLKELVNVFGIVFKMKR